MEYENMIKRHTKQETEMTRKALMNFISFIYTIIFIDI